MSNGFTEKMEQDYLDELFMQDAARVIDAELLEDVNASLEMEIDEAWLKQVADSTARQIQKKKRKQSAHYLGKRIVRMAAIFVITFCILFSGAYVSVGAARDVINNFFIGRPHRRASVVYPVNVEGEVYSIIPENWHGPIYPTWLPHGYVHANSGTQLDKYWWLCYSLDDNILKTIGIYAWDETYTPHIDTENYDAVDETTIQNVPATIYYDRRNECYALIMAKNNLLIQIMGTIDQEEIVHIADCLAF